MIIIVIFIIISTIIIIITIIHNCIAKEIITNPFQALPLQN